MPTNQPAIDTELTPYQKALAEFVTNKQLETDPKAKFQYDHAVKELANSVLQGMAGDSSIVALLAGLEKLKSSNVLAKQEKFLLIQLDEAIGALDKFITLIRGCDERLLVYSSLSNAEPKDLIALANELCETLVRDKNYESLITASVLSSQFAFRMIDAAKKDPLLNAQICKTTEWATVEASRDMSIKPIQWITKFPIHLLTLKKDYLATLSEAQPKPVSVYGLLQEKFAELSTNINEFQRVTESSSKYDLGKQIANGVSLAQFAKLADLSPMLCNQLTVGEFFTKVLPPAAAKLLGLDDKKNNKLLEQPLTPANLAIFANIASNTPELGFLNNLANPVIRIELNPALQTFVPKAALTLSIADILVLNRMFMALVVEKEEFNKRKTNSSPLVRLTRAPVALTRSGKKNDFLEKFNEIVNTTLSEDSLDQATKTALASITAKSSTATIDHPLAEEKTVADIATDQASLLEIYQAQLDFTANWQVIQQKLQKFLNSDTSIPKKYDVVPKIKKLLETFAINPTTGLRGQAIDAIIKTLPADFETLGKTFLKELAISLKEADRLTAIVGDVPFTAMTEFKDLGILANLLNNNLAFEKLWNNLNYPTEAADKKLVVTTINEILNCEYSKDSLYDYSGHIRSKSSDAIELLTNEYNRQLLIKDIKDEHIGGAIKAVFAANPTLVLDNKALLTLNVFLEITAKLSTFNSDGLIKNLNRLPELASPNSIVKIAKYKFTKLELATIKNGFLTTSKNTLSQSLYFKDEKTGFNIAKLTQDLKKIIEESKTANQLLKKPLLGKTTAEFAACFKAQSDSLVENATQLANINQVVTLLQNVIKDNADKPFLGVSKSKVDSCLTLLKEAERKQLLAVKNCEKSLESRATSLLKEIDQLTQQAQNVIPDESLDKQHIEQLRGKLLAVVAELRDLRAAVNKVMTIGGLGFSKNVADLISDLEIKAGIENIPGSYNKYFLLEKHAEDLSLKLNLPKQAKGYIHMLELILAKIENDNPEVIAQFIREQNLDQVVPLRNLFTNSNDVRLIPLEKMLSIKYPAVRDELIKYNKENKISQNKVDSSLEDSKLTPKFPH